MKLTMFIGGFLIAHGVMHPLVIMPSGGPDGPLTRGVLHPGRAWLWSALGLSEGTSRVILVGLMGIALVAYVIAGVGYFGPYAWWRPAAVAGSVASLLALGLYWHWWVTAGVLLDLLILLAIILRWAPARP